MDIKHDCLTVAIQILFSKNLITFEEVRQAELENGLNGIYNLLCDKYNTIKEKQVNEVENWLANNIDLDE